MAYTAANVCQQWNLPRQGFDKCVSVCMCVQSMNSLPKSL